MGQIAITLGNRTYRLACGQGEEKRLELLAADVKARVEKLAREFGQPADERLLLMAAVLLADELLDLREAHEAMLEAAAEVLRETSQTEAASAPKAGAAKSPQASAAASPAPAAAKGKPSAA
jgi:cell division protein ZapA